MSERPLYEDGSTLTEEVRFFADLQSHTSHEHYRWRKLPLAYRIDCAAISILSNRVEGYGEFKRRQVEMATYPTLILSLHKWDDLVRYSLYGWSRLYVRWDDYDAMLPVSTSTEKYPVTFGGREDRGDWQDQEPVVHIPVSEFRLLELERSVEVPSFQGDLKSWSL